MSTSHCSSQYFPSDKHTGRLEQPSGQGLGGFGLSNSVSGNGKYLAVGAPTYPFVYLRQGGLAGRVGPGQVTIYKQDKCKKWNLIQNITAPNGNNFSNYPSTDRTGLHTDFGFGVAFNKNGKYLAISGTGDDQSGQLNGAIWVYIRNDDTGFYEIMQKVVPVIPGNTIFALLGAGGYDITINDDGTLIATGVIGVLNAEVNGGVIVISRTGDKWSQLLMEGKFYIPAPSDLTQGATFGFSVQFNSTGEYLVVGAPNDEGNPNTPYNNEGRGATYVFKSRPEKNQIRLLNGTIEYKNSSSGFVYEQVGNKLVGSPTSTTQNQGYPVAITGDGKTIASYGSDVNGNAYVYIFDKQDDQYIQTNALNLDVIGQGSDLSPGQNQSGGLSFNRRGNILAVGIPSSMNMKGSIRIYKRKHKSITFNLKQTITDPNSENTAHQGTSVSLDDSGDILTFGGASENNSKGSEFVWIKKSSN